MSKPTLTDSNITSLMDMLASEDGVIRQKARESLVLIGKPAASPLIKALRHSKDDQVRWEATKALGEIIAPRSIPVLVAALEDSNGDVAWLAAEALSKFKKTAWSRLLGALLKNGQNSDALRKSAHHVLLNQKEDGFDDLLGNLMRALESSAAIELTPSAAFDILKQIKERS